MIPPKVWASKRYLIKLVNGATNMTENIIRLERAIVKFCDGLTVDGYRLRMGNLEWELQGRVQF